MSDNDLDIRCRLCNHPFTTDKQFAIKNKRVFCPSCCKAFDVNITETKEASDWYKKYILAQSDFEDDDPDDGVPF